MKLQVIDLSEFRGKSHFKDGDTKNHLVAKPVCRYFETIVNPNLGGVHFEKLGGY